MAADAKTTYSEQLLNSIATSSADLFGSYKIELIPDGTAFDTQSRDAKFSHSSILGFAGEDMRGSISLCCTTEVLQNTHPLMRIGQKPSDDNLNDWIGELSNQLLGRIKNRLLRYSIDFDLSTPTIVRGTDVNVMSVEGTPLVVFWYRSGGQPIAISFCAMTKPGLEWIEREDGQGPMLEEGADILF